MYYVALFKKTNKICKINVSWRYIILFIVIVYRVVLRDKYFKANDDLSTFTILINAIEDFPRYFLEDMMLYNLMPY